MDAVTDSVAGDHDELRALLILDQLPGIGLATLRRLVSAVGSAERVLTASSHRLRAVLGRSPPRLRADRETRRLVDEGLARARALDMVTLTWSDAPYPAALLHLADPPPVLFLRGRAELISAGMVTVVGARRSTARGRDVAERLGGALARAGTCVASGLALGIDGAAHRGALRAEGDTVAVVGRGADEAYPRSHAKMFRRIVERGLVVSEFLPGTPPLPHHFPRRNRILAALARSVVVVEAGARSGALITVDHALDLGVDVWAVPGPIDAPSCAGSNRLLADGARPLHSIDAFVGAATGAGRRPLPTPDGRFGRVLGELGSETLDVDHIALRMGLSAREALALLTEMELGGLVRQLPGMRFRKVA